jgi:hypothetical protein
MADALTVNTDCGRQGLKNENLYRTTELASGHRPFSRLRPRAHVRVFACRRAAMDPETTRGLRTGCNATLQSVHPGRSAYLSLHVRLPALSQPRLPRLLRRPQKESEAPLRNPITGIVRCCARATSGQAAALPSVARLHYQFGKLSRCVDYTGFDGSSARTACIRLPRSTLYFCAHPLRFCGR